MASQPQAASETSPLLGPQQQQDSFRPPGRLQAFREHLSRWRSLYVCVLLILVLNVPGNMGEVPQLRMLEMGVCRQYYASHDPSQIDHRGSVPERLCKLPQIQSSLATMRGFMAMLEAVCGLVVAVPYGIFADKKGHRLMFCLCILGFLLRESWTFISLYFYQTFPLKAVYAAPFMVLVGGGSIVVSPMLLAIIAASTPAESRTASFFWIHLAILATQFVAPPLAALLMGLIGPHLAFLVAIPFESLTFLVLFFLPDNTKNKLADDASTPSDTSIRTAKDGSVVTQTIHRITRAIRRDVVAIISMKSLLLGLCALVVGKMARPIMELMLQFMSVRFGWPIKKTTVLLSIQAATEIGLFLLVLPAVNSFLLKRYTDEFAANLTLAKISIVFLTLGTLCMGLSPTAPAFITAIVMHTFGNGYSAVVRSLVTSLVPKDRISLLYTAMAVFEGLTVMGASPLLQLSFSWGIEQGGSYMSLPFYIAAGLYGAAGCTLFLVNFKSQKTVESD